MTKIQFNFQGKRRTHEFFFGVHPGVNGFSLRDDRGIMHDCLDWTRVYLKKRVEQ